MTRPCATCRQLRPLRDFDLGGGQMSATCLDCASENARLENRRARAGRSSKIGALESQRRALIVALVKIDAEIDALRGRPTPPPVMLDDIALVDVDTTFGEDDEESDSDADRDRTGDELS